MTAQEFVIWLQGFLEATSEIEGHHLLKIKNKLNEVKPNSNEIIPLKFPTSPSNFPTPKTNPYNPFIGTGLTLNDKVMYSEICSCNPSNGGNGICGCVIGNKMVDRPIKPILNG